jgi:hypothetical protein
MIWIWVAAVAVLILAIRWVIRAPRESSARKAAAFRIPNPDPNLFMPRGFDFYVRLDAVRRAAMLDALRNAIGSDGTLYDQDTHAVVLWHAFEPPEALLQRLSKELQAQVIWLAFQKQVDAFAYTRWENGIMFRRLAFGCYEKERAWEQVDGEPESWEASAIFDERRLERRFSQTDRPGGELSYSPDGKEELRQLWKARHLMVDSEEPNINGRDVAEAVAIEYRLPGWS